MVHSFNIFDLFRGVRPMARTLGEPPSNVAAWKRVGRIPAEKQPNVLAVGLKLGLPITAEHVVFPLGQPHHNLATDVAPQPTDVVCDRTAGLQRKDSAA
jgi:hypothetical protein